MSALHLITTRIYENHIAWAPGGGYGGGGGGGHGGGGGAGVGKGGGNGGGNPKGVLYGDQIVVLRDLDPSDGGGNGEPLYDSYNLDGQLIAVGYDALGDVRPGDADGLFPIYFDMVGEGDYEIPAAMLPYVQEVELERANVARAPAPVMEKSLAAAVEKLLAADVVETDPAGRLMYSTDGGASFLTIDSPLENLALYAALMTAGGSSAWPDVQDNWNAVQLGEGTADLSFLATLEGFDPAALMGAAWSKEGEITLDALLYENTTLGVNQVTYNEGEPTVDYFDFTEAGTESYDHVRSAVYGDTWLQWITYDPVTGEPEFTYGTVYDAVFGGVEWGAAEDVYLAVDTLGNADPTDDDFIFVDAQNAGVNDFAQAADDARAVIEFMHANVAIEIDEAMVPEGYDLFV